MKFIFSEIPKYCISLKRNKDRRNAVSEQFKAQGIKFEFFDAVDKLDLVVPETSPKINEGNAAGILGCAMSHIAVIRKAKELKLPAVCVFEDDVIFCDDFKNRIAYIESLPNFDFDIFCLGGHFDKNTSSEYCENTNYDYIKRVYKQGGTYALIFTEKTYDFILRNWNYTLGADEFYSNFVYKRFNTYALVPFLVGVMPNNSDILGTFWKYDNVDWHYQQKPLKELTQQQRIDLKDVTFIIPVKIESRDREFNFIRVMKYLCDNFNTTILIKECDGDSKVLELIKRVNTKGCNIQHVWEIDNSGIFHRTRHLNQLLAMVKTPIVVNYDCDVIFKRETYVLAVNKILKEGYDLIYPFGKGEEQVEINYPDKNNYDEDLISLTNYHTTWGSLAGHAQFFRTKAYIEGGMENENFISYSPEDRERMDRFIKLGYKVDWLTGQKVYHLAHSRGVNSSAQNPHFSQGEALYYRLQNMTKSELIEYYKGQEYLKKYKT